MAESLLAFRDGGDSTLGMAGAILIAEAIGNLDTCAQFAVQYTQFMNRKA
jgi:hypothetical protein